MIHFPRGIFYTAIFPIFQTEKSLKLILETANLQLSPLLHPGKKGTDNDNESWKDDWVKQIKVSVGKTLRCKATTLDSRPCKGTVAFAMAVIHLFCDLTANRDFQNRYNAEVQQLETAVPYTHRRA